jgi:hypothetical protein
VIKSSQAERGKKNFSKSQPELLKRKRLRTYY